MGLAHKIWCRSTLKGYGRKLLIVILKIYDINFDSGEFDRSHVENGVRMQKLWTVKVCRQKLPKTARQRGREKFQYNFFN
jgi:hypothetical protein